MVNKDNTCLHLQGAPSWTFRSSDTVITEGEGEGYVCPGIVDQTCCITSDDNRSINYPVHESHPHRVTRSLLITHRLDSPPLDPRVLEYLLVSPAWTLESQLTALVTLTHFGICVSCDIPALTNLGCMPQRDYCMNIKGVFVIQIVWVFGQERILFADLLRTSLLGCKSWLTTLLIA